MNEETKTRAWFLTLFEQNFENLKIPKELYAADQKSYEELAVCLMNIWKTVPGRTGAVAVCISKEGAFHVHMAVYSHSPISFKTVHNILGKPHIEPQRGTKQQMRAYLTKSGQFEEKGEKVLFTYGLESLRSAQPEDLLEEAQKLIDSGLTPNEIFDENIKYRRYQTEIQGAYVAKRIAEIPVEKDMKVYWHCGGSGTGKSHTYFELCEKYGKENIYYYNDFKHGMDKYNIQGCPSTLFIDELKPNSMPFRDLLVLLDKNSRAQYHCRYENAYALWTEVHITSILSPSKFYDAMFDDFDKDGKRNEPIYQLLRRITKVIWHYHIAEKNFYGQLSINPDISDEEARRRVKEEKARQLSVPASSTAQAALAGFGDITAIKVGNR